MAPFRQDEVEGFDFMFLFCSIVPLSFFVPSCFFSSVPFLLLFV